MTTSPGPLGRRPPADFEHVERYPLTAATAPSVPTPVVLGINWYVEFDAPAKDGQGHYWIARDGKLTKVRGGHCVCLKPRGVTDTAAWWDFYDQGAEGACVGFGSSRAMTLLNRKRYFARWLWDKAKAIDEWSETNPGDDQGTSVRAGLDVLRLQGHVSWRTSYEPLNVDWRHRDDLVGAVAEGIKANRWATSTQDALDVLGYGDLDYVDVINSWGRSYPHLVRMPATVLEQLRKEDGEVGIVTDR
jgi:hypothetical protein